VRPSWARSETLTTTRCARASSPRSNARFSTGTGSRRRARRGSRSSNSATPRSGMARRIRAVTPRERDQSRRTRACHRASRPSRTSPSGGPKRGPSLTAASLDGRAILRVGGRMAPPGAEQRMAQRRTNCRQITYADPSPQPSTKPGCGPAYILWDGVPFPPCQ
jgi:hypothetical protein